MDVLEKVFDRGTEVARSLSPAARMMCAGALVVVVLGLAWLARPGATAADTYLMGRQNFSAAQLRDMEGAFGKAGLADYEIEGDRVRVPRGQQAKYMAALDEAGAMPQDFGESLRQAVNSGGFMVSGSRQQAQMKIALESDLQLVISRMKGVKSAFVHIAEETTRSFPPQKSVTASVSIEPAEAAGVDNATLESIRSFVASAWAGLRPEAVTVVAMHHAAEPTVPQEAALQDPALLWLGDNWQTLGVGGFLLAGFALVWLAIRAILQPAPSPAPATSEPVALAVAETVRAVEYAAAGTSGGSTAAPLESLRQELAIVIRHDPQAAAGVLRTWIGNAKA